MSCGRRPIIGALFAVGFAALSGGCAQPKDVNSIGMHFVQINPGEFTMGAGEREAGNEFSEAPHPVVISQSYMLAMYEVTQAQYMEVMGTNPSSVKNPGLPVEQVCWDDAVEFCRRLSERPEEKAAGYIYRLPTEAEWEFACRARMASTHSLSDLSSNQLRDYAWFQDNSGGESHLVGEKLPNAFGVYDMHGNVAEWCQDWLGNYVTGRQTDPKGPAQGTKRVCRGGSFKSVDKTCRSASRFGYEPDVKLPTVGFRVVRERRQATLPP